MKKYILIEAEGPEDPCGECQDMRLFNALAKDYDDLKEEIEGLKAIIKGHRDKIEALEWQVKKLGGLPTYSYNTLTPSGSAAWSTF